MNVRAKVSSKGQVVIPKSMRDALAIVDGSEVEFISQNDGILLKPVDAFDPRFPRVAAGEFLKHVVKINRPFPSDAEIEQAMLDEAARRFDATRR